MPPRIPTQADLTPLLPLHVTIQPPSPPESTTSVLILLHGLGDSEEPFSAFARHMALPGVLSLSVRGPSVLPPSLLDEDTRGGYHWGDDIQLDSSTGEIDPDPGFARAERLVMEGLVRGVLVGECGWDMGHIMVFGFGQGGSLALGMAAVSPQGEAGCEARDVFNGIVSVGGPLPRSMLSGRGRRDGAAPEKSRTHVLLCQVGREDEDAVRRQFAHVSVVRWRREGVSMPRDRDDMFPLMKFFAERLRSGGW
ncbi:hypothetical protein E4U53_005810 [Claviceps sorghi]|nr:hypothetical protein E4U53_005810 [Claviceps sorghi]